MHQRISELLNESGLLVYVSPHHTVAQAVNLMAHHNVGSVLVLENRRKLVGIFTERDLLRRVAAPGLNMDDTPITDVMTRDVIVVSSETSCSDVLTLMDRRHIRHVPVAEDEQLIGLISLRDLLRHDNSEKGFELQQLREYVVARPYPMYPA